nr:hypothetical protein [Paraburkholderia tropica]
MNGSAGARDNGYGKSAVNAAGGWPSMAAMVSSGIVAGLTGAICIWIYEAVVWVGVQHLLTLGGIPSNATGLVFGKHVQQSLGIGAYVLGTIIHFAFAAAWGVLFALVWPYFQRRGYEATFIALFYAILAWIAMHVAISIASDNHPNYFDPNVVIGGFMSHFCFTVPLALVVKRRYAALRASQR